MGTFKSLKITYKHKGDFSKTEKFLKNLRIKRFKEAVEKYAQQGVDALRDATPVDSGLTRDSWYYTIVEYPDTHSLVIYWNNSNLPRGWYRVAMGIQYGHYVKGGHWVEGVDYVNPAMKPIFDDIAESAWKEVARL